MNKPFRVLCAVLLLMMLCITACGTEPEPVKSPDPTPGKSGNEVISKGVGFVITLGKSSDGTPRYDYTVTANDGTVIESASCPVQPKVAPLSKTLLGFRFSNDERSWCRYYDIEKGVASPSYFGAFWDNGSLVAYNDYQKNGVLTVCDIFDPEGFRSEAKLPAGASELTVTAAVPSEDGSVLTVEYMSDLSADRWTAELALK